MDQRQETKKRIVCNDYKSHLFSLRESLISNTQNNKDEVAFPHLLNNILIIELQTLPEKNMQTVNYKSKLRRC